ncbi:MAG: hypothetical protein LUH04_12535, partial [Clostridium sp.]|nr:hypothetical protein [Clostridium sp.]
IMIYASRKSDNQIIKIGIKSHIFYLRYSDRDKVQLDFSDCQDLYWRLPFPDEDHLQIGECKNETFFRKYVLDGKIWIHRYCMLKYDETILKHCQSLSEQSFLDSPEWKNDCRLVCKHDPDSLLNAEVIKTWGTRRIGDREMSLLYLDSLKNTKDEMRIGIRCAVCGQIWDFAFPEIEYLILDNEMRKRIYLQCMEYWENLNKGEIYPYPMKRETEELNIKLSRRRDLFDSQYEVSVRMKSDDDVEYEYFKEFEGAYNFFHNV